jgi:hypothetical protein
MVEFVESSCTKCKPNKNKAFYQENEYLSLWKRDLDDKSRNKKIEQIVSSRGPYERILDIGTGSGMQIRRNIENNWLTNNGEIIGIDVNEEGIVHSINDYKKWAIEKGYIVKSQKDLSFFIIKNNKSYKVRLIPGSVYELSSMSLGEFPLITALSLYEHTNIEKSLLETKKALSKNGLLYAPSNYNGITKVTPIPSELNNTQDDSIMKLFNETMINSQYTGGIDVGECCCADVMEIIAKRFKLTVLASENSDWSITKDSSKYERKAYRMFIDAIYNGLKSLSGNKKETQEHLGVTSEHLDFWYENAKENFESGRGVYFCHNKDVLIKNI